MVDHDCKSDLPLIHIYISFGDEFSLNSQIIGSSVFGFLSSFSPKYKSNSTIANNHTNNWNDIGDNKEYDIVTKNRKKISFIVSLIFHTVSEDI